MDSGQHGSSPSLLSRDYPSCCMVAQPFQLFASLCPELTLVSWSQAKVRERDTLSVLGPGWGSVGLGTLIIAGHGFFENIPYEKKEKKIIIFLLRNQKSGLWRNSLRFFYGCSVNRLVLVLR